MSRRRKGEQLGDELCTGKTASPADGVWLAVDSVDWATRTGGVA